jgi:hypothetical protein
MIGSSLKSNEKGKSCCFALSLDSQRASHSTIVRAIQVVDDLDSRNAEVLETTFRQISDIQEASNTCSETGTRISREIDLCGFRLLFGWKIG